MKPRRFWIAAPFVVAGLACGVLPARSAEPHWPQAVALATASPGGTYHAYGAGLARVLTRELGIAVSMRETAGPSENIRLIEAGEAQIGFVTTGAALEGWSGSGDWTGGKQFRAIRAMFPMYDTPFHFVARQDSGVAHLSALDGKAVGVGPEGGTAATYVPRMLPKLGVQARLVHGTWADLAAALRSGQLDGLAVAAGAPFPAIAELEAQRAIRYLPLTRDAVATLRLAVPGARIDLDPGGDLPVPQAALRDDRHLQLRRGAPRPARRPCLPDRPGGLRLPCRDDGGAPGGGGHRAGQLRPQHLAALALGSGPVLREQGGARRPRRGLRGCARRRLESAASLP